VKTDLNTESPNHWACDKCQIIIDNEVNCCPKCGGTEKRDRTRFVGERIERQPDGTEATCKYYYNDKGQYVSEKPRFISTEVNEPNLELMAKFFYNLSKKQGPRKRWFFFLRFFLDFLYRNLLLGCLRECEQIEEVTSSSSNETSMAPHSLLLGEMVHHE